MKKNYSILCLMALTSVMLASCGKIEPNSEPAKVKQSENTPTYTVTWKDEDGTILEVDRDVAYGADPSFDHPQPTKASDGGHQYNFSGWEPSLSPVTQDVTYTASYVSLAKGCQITWKNDDGTILMNQTVSYGATPSYTGSTPSKASTDQYSYSFIGWNPSIKSVTQDTTYTAQFEAHIRSYTVTWENYDGTVLKVDQNVPYGEIPSYSGSTPVRATDYTSTQETSYTFSGWTTTVSQVTQDITYTAVFTSAQYDIYTISYDLNGGSLSGLNPSTSTTTDSLLIDHEPTRTGYTFTGWTGSNGSVPQKEVNVIAGTTGNLSYKANWQANQYTVTLDANGGTVSQSTVTVTYDSAYALPEPTAMKEGYQTFVGWFDSNGNQYDGTKYQYAGDITLTAKYGSPVSYTITYDLDGGTNDASNPATYTIEDNITLKAPTKNNKGFAGWTGSNGDTPQTEVTIAKGTTGNLSYKANWTLPTYSVGGTLTFGSYPQTKVTDSTLVAALASATDTDNDGWLNYDNEEYAKQGSDYYKVEPISWRVLSADNTDHKYMIVSEKVLDQVPYYTSTSDRTISGATVYANNYKYSTLRAWMNGYDGSSYSVANYSGKGFLNTAFTSSEQSMIVTTDVDNSVSSTGYSSNSYACENTSDKVFSLSYSEATNSSYGFSSNSTRIAYATGYASAKGVYVSGGAYYWLRSPYDYYSDSAGDVYDDGGINYITVYYTAMGVRPALSLRIS